MTNRLTGYSTVLLRLALGSAFLSAVADRFGLWGAYGEPGVAWGDFAHFTAYTAALNWFAPANLIPALAWAATAAEVALALGLLLGLYTRASALSSGLLLMLFATAMTLALGVKAPLNYSVLSAAAGALLLSAQDSFAWSLDSLMRRRSAGGSRGLRASRRPAGSAPAGGRA
ncbi:MAG TPA: DoxX family membrane protein [Pyrinomonadaceae bacterium]|jgi:uncharacterized membrane protein YphA (DoxX/SURF4 family)